MVLFLNVPLIYLLKSKPILFSAFIYHTWTDRIWPIIKVEEEEEDESVSKFTPANPETFSAPEESVD